MADQHATQIRTLAGAAIVAACDSELLMAQQFAERFAVPEIFGDVLSMLASVRPDVVHVTTPPQSHKDVATKCVNAGASVYIEKPFTLNTGDAVELIDLAERKGVKLTVGHNGQFTDAIARARRLIQNGFLGGPVVHMESHYGYELGDPAFAKAMLGDPSHWARKLPGSLPHNIISHGVSRIAEFMTGDAITVQAQGFSSPFLRRIGQGDIIDELRLLIKDEHATTAYFTFSCQISPALHQFRVYGPQRSIVVDDDHQIVLTLDNAQYKSYLRLFVPPAQFAGQYVRNLGRNIWRFARRDLHLPNDAGLRALISAFYDCVGGTGPLPVPYREILLTARIMDQAFQQLPRG